uniref:Uncharacterized protein n=1 Tax=Rhizophora mucronata TaxID=61149 RepID=A0A2P2QUV4_RHIMU
MDDDWGDLDGFVVMKMCFAFVIFMGDLLF